MKDYKEADDSSELGTDEPDIYLGEGRMPYYHFSGQRKASPPDGFVKHLKQELPWWYAVILVGVAVAGFFIGAWL